MKRILNLFVVLALLILVGCAGTQVQRNSEPGLDITGKKVYVIVDEAPHHADMTDKLDSLWKVYAEQNSMEVEYYLNNALTFEPVKFPEAFSRCEGGYGMHIGINGFDYSVGSNYNAATGMMSSYESKTVGYVASLYNCDMRKKVWVMTVSTNGAYSMMAQTELLKSIFKDFKENGILKENK